MAILRAVHIPGGDESKTETYDIDWEDLTVDEVDQLERLCERPSDQIVDRIQSGWRGDVLRLLYVWRLRTEPELTWDSMAIAIKHTDITFSNPKAEKAPKAAGTARRGSAQ